MAMTTSLERWNVSFTPPHLHRESIRPVFHLSLKEGEEGMVTAQCVEVPAAITQGRNKDEAIRRSFDAIASALDALGRGETEFVVLPTEG